MQTMPASGQLNARSQFSAITSRSSGAPTFARPASATHAAMLARRAGSGSLGCQLSPGCAAANATTCCPVPLPSSRMMPVSGRCRLRTPRIGCRLRAAAGAYCRVSSGIDPGFTKFAQQRTLKRRRLRRKDARDR
jgi:hypothetical protein